MKRKIELPTRASVARKINLGIGLSGIDCMSIGKEDHDVQIEALQEAYNQGYEDARPKWLNVSAAEQNREYLAIFQGNSVGHVCLGCEGWFLVNDSWESKLSPPKLIMPIPDFETE